MTSSREEDERVMEILAAARRKPAAEREAYLQSACAGDEDLRREVVDALSWEERMGGFLQQPVAVIADGNPDSAVTAAVQFAAGLEIGQYRIESKLGEGGMSTRLARSRYPAWPPGRDQVSLRRSGRCGGPPPFSAGGADGLFAESSAHRYRV